ncbi:acid phosphatase [Cordyceps militaris]|uniref:Acid phosphatase n=1 Tax=Cordyceps militaris TaxID=73501 RepID=A0A2H4SEG5_CORMI|nr:acid phosphatase [Cordyceps militaris]
MKIALALATLQGLVVHGIRIVQSNDDGWAELFTRSFNDVLRAAGHDVVLSCPASDNSGCSSFDDKPKSRVMPCQYNSCPEYAGPTGFNASRPDLHWVNSFSTTAMRYGIQTFGPQHWGDTAELAVAGVNVGANIFLTVPFSGTVGAAVWAAGRAHIPAIAFSGDEDRRKTARWDTFPPPPAAAVYAQLAMNLTNVVIAGGKPYLPKEVFLNVNFPRINERCSDPATFRWVLTRINPGWFSPKDVKWCGRRRLPTERRVHSKKRCYVSVSIGNARDKTTSNDVKKQQMVLDRLKSMLSCMP